MRRHAADVAAALFLLAVVYLLVRPRSAAADAVKGLSDALVALVTAATHI